jgi:hypothetical protein
MNLDIFMTYADKMIRKYEKRIFQEKASLDEKEIFHAELVEIRQKLWDKFWKLKNGNI